MRIGVVSDTHGAAGCFRAAIEQMGKVDMLIHAGDFYNDALALEKETGMKIVAVTGNCDRPVPDMDEKELKVDGYKVLVTHGNKYGVKSGNHHLIEKLKKGGYDLIIFGHSHVPEVVYLPEGILMNPGSPSRPRGGSNRTYGIIETGPEGIKAYIHDLKW